MDRDIEKSLLSWKDQPDRSPLLVRGARQVGKSYIIQKFGQQLFENIVTINFELQPELMSSFATLDPTNILNTLVPLTRQRIEKGKTLLFLDEIQECSNAIRALRYFKEKLPDLHVIGAGSLLEFTLNDANFRLPVGRIQSLYLKPLSFKEYLLAGGYKDLQAALQNATCESPIAEPLHQHLLKLIREYMALGGMPAVLQNFFTHHDYGQCMNIQTNLLNTYRQDFGKYASQADSKYLRRLFERAPGLIAEDFKYVKVDPDMRSRDIKKALDMLHNAGLTYPIYATTASGIPLISLINEKKFKILFLDIGLMLRACKLESELLISNDVLLVNRGVLAEQFVGQELLAYAPFVEESQLYFWSREQRSSTAEIDFVIAIGPTIIPIEIKAGKTGRLKSLKLFMEEKKSKLGIKISQEPLRIEQNILSIPIYMVSELERLARSYL